MSQVPNPRVPVVWCGPHTLQCGDEPGSPRLDVTDAEAELLFAWREGRETPWSSRVASSSADGRQKELLRFHARATFDGEATKSGLDPSELSDGETAHEAGARAERRRRAILELLGDADLCDAVAAALVGSGLGAASERPGPSSAPSFGAQRRIGVLAGAAWPHPSHVAPWMRAAVPHIAITALSHGVEVSPLIRPGRTPCLRCRELHRADEDPRWPIAFTQLIGRTVPTVEHSVRSAAAALAAITLLDAVDRPDSAISGYRISPGGCVAVTRWEFHPRCGCREFAWSAVRKAETVQEG